MKNLISAILILASAGAQAQEQCSYTGTNLDFESVPGKVCVNTFSPQFKPKYLVYVTEENRERLDARRSEVGTLLVRGELPDDCLSDFIMGIDPSAYREHCYTVEHLQEMKALWNQALARQEVGKNFSDFFGLQTSKPNWQGLIKRLRAIVESQPPTTGPAPQTSR